ncbi:MAG: hypothetical protein V2I47_09715, partial [Bacteroidales bacterium]|nr:hypothetical protein [Bacteroidales bacterium]
MRHVLFVICLIVVLGSCKPLTYIPSYSEKFVIDLTRYTDKQFLITPEVYTGDYESIGILAIAFYPTARRVKNSESASNNSDQFIVQGSWVAEKVKAEEVVDILYEDAKNMGADAIMNFR